MNDPERHKGNRVSTPSGIACTSGLLLLVLCASVARSAPPTVAYLFPGGAQRGTTVEVTAGGSFERWPVQVRASSPGITAKAAKEKGKLTVTVAADVEPGSYWLWLYDEQGASIAHPLLIGNLPEVNEQEPNDDVRAAQSLPFSAVTVNGKLA